MLFKRATMRYLTTFPKTKYVKLDQDGLYFELRNKFKGMTVSLKVSIPINWLINPRTFM